MSDRKIKLIAWVIVTFIWVFIIPFKVSVDWTIRDIIENIAIRFSIMLMILYFTY